VKLTNLEAIEAQNALAELSKREDIPIRASLDIALISNMIDTQVKAYGVVLQNLYKKYSIKAEPTETGTRFTCFAGTEPKEGEEVDEETAKLRQENLQGFFEQLDDLLGQKTEDLVFKKIKLPDTISIKSEILKPLTQFVEVG